MKERHGQDWAQYIHPDFQYRCALEHDTNISFVTEDEDRLFQHLVKAHSEGFQESELHGIARRSKVAIPSAVAECILCKEDVGKHPERTEPKAMAHDENKTGKGKAKKLEDQELIEFKTAESGLGRANEKAGKSTKEESPKPRVGFTLPPGHRELDTTAIALEDEFKIVSRGNVDHEYFGGIRAKLHKHLAAHVRSVAFLSLRWWDDERDSGSQGSIEVRMRGDAESNSSQALGDSDIEALQISETVDVIVQTQLEGLEITEDKPLSLQRNVVARENYALIEETDSFADKHCNVNEELQLIQGYYTITCSCESCSSTGSYRPLGEPAILESFEDWEEVEALTANYEPEGHTRLRVTITRKLGRVPKRMPLHVPQKNAISMFRLELDAAMVRMPSGTVKPYIPKDRLEHLTQRKKIKELVQDPSADFRTTIDDIRGRELLAERIYRDAYLLLLIVVYHGVTLKLVEDMLDRQPGKIQLPLLPEPPKWLQEDDSQSTDSHETRSLRMAYNICYEGQWAFQAAVFENGENQVFDNDIIVPYLWKTKIGTGAHSTVYRVKIEPSHQKLYELPEVCLITLQNW